VFTDLIFDFYGTLVDFSHESVREHERESYEFMIQNKFKMDFSKFREQMNATYLELYEESQAHHREYRIEDVLNRFFIKNFKAEAPENFISKMARIHQDEWNEGAVFYEGMTDFIEELAQTYRLSIISNTHCPIIIERNLGKMKIKERFSVVMTSIEHGMRKPHPSIFLDTLKQLGTEPHRAVYVGDTFTDDYLAAKSVGMKAFWIDREKKKLDAEDRLDHVFDLKEKLRSN
jgi:putative hydrolase of the HAD superfamily